MCMPKWYTYFRFHCDAQNDKADNANFFITSKRTIAVIIQSKKKINFYSKETHYPYFHVAGNLCETSADGSHPLESG